MQHSDTQDIEEVTLSQVFTPAWKQRKKIMIISLVLAAVTLGVNFLLPVYYMSSAVVLPETDKSKAGLLNQFAGLASLAGVSVQAGDISRLYPVILTSDAVLVNVINRKYQTQQFKDSVDLIGYFELNESSREKNLDEALKTLRKLISVSFDNKTSVVSVTLEMREPQLAADVLNALLAELDLFLREKKTSSASEQRKWIESRLDQVEGELRGAEERLKDFRERNRRVSDSPQLLLMQERLLREVQVKGTIVIELRKQAEIAKIEEIKQVSTINVLDEGRAPVRKERPKRATNTAIAFLLGLVGTAGYFAVREVYGGRVRAFVQGLSK